MVMYKTEDSAAGGLDRQTRRTLLVNLLLRELALLAHELADDAAEEVGLAGPAGISRGVLGGAAVVQVVVRVGVVVWDEAAVTNCPTPGC